MRIATYNLENFGRVRDTLPLDERISALRPRLEHLNADILCLQEVDCDSNHELSALEELLRGSDYQDYFRAVTTERSGGYRDIHNLVVLSRYPLIRRRQLTNQLVEPIEYRWASATRDGSSVTRLSWDRPILHVTIDVEGTVIEVLNVHLRSPLPSAVPGQKTGPFSFRTPWAWAEGVYVSSIKRNGQALECRGLVDELFDAEEDARIVVCGDFNAEIESLPLEIISLPVKATDDPSFARRGLVELSTAVPQEHRYSVIHGGRRLLLDHVLVSRALFSHFEGTAIHRQDLEDEQSDYHLGKRRPGSHHAPISADFELGELER